jgi:hypothetical protein
MAAGRIKRAVQLVELHIQLRDGMGTIDANGNATIGCRLTNFSHRKDYGRWRSDVADNQ